MVYRSQSAEQALRDFNNEFPPGQVVGEEDNSRLQGNWVGQERTRYDFVLKFLSSNSTTRGYYVHNFQDRKGNRFLAFLDCEYIKIEDQELSTGDCFGCKATVNRHGINTYKYGDNEPFKETILNRMKFKTYIGKKI